MGVRMKSMTVHKMDDLLVEAIRKRAESSGDSINAMIKKLLATAVGIEDSQSTDRKPSGYRRFLGRWSQSDAIDFERQTAEFERIDTEDWTS